MILMRTGGAQLIIPGVEVVQAGQSGGAALLSVPVPVLGSELFTTANAASDPYGNEANATTGVTASNSTLSSVTDPAAGSYAIKVTSTGSSGQGLIDFTPVNTWLQIRTTVKRGAQGTAQLISNSNLNGSNVSVAAGAYQALVLGWRTASGGTRRMFHRAGSTINDELLFDNFSAKPLILASLMSVMDYGITHAVTKAKVTLVANAGAGVVANVDSATGPANLVIAYHDRVACWLVKCVAGVYTNLIQTTTAYVAGATIEIRRADATNTYQLWYNGSQVGTNQTIADAGIIYNTLHGYFNLDANNTLTDFSCVGNLAVGGLQYSPYRIYDTFTDTNGTLLPAHVSEKGPAWVKVGSYDIAIQTNLAQGAGPSAGNNALATLNIGQADGILEATLRTASGSAPFAGLAFRVTDANNFADLTISESADSFAINETITGSGNVRATASETINALTDYNVRCVLQGAIVTAFLDGANRLFYGSLATPTITAHGLRLDDATSGPGLADLFTLRPLTFSRVSTKTLEATSGADDWLGRLTLQERSDGVWLRFYRSALAHSPSGNAGIMHIKFSADQGVTWSVEDKTIAGSSVTGFPIAGHSADASGGMARECANGDLLFIAREELVGGKNGSWVYRSIDGGANWTSQGQINSDDTLMASGQIVVVGSTLYGTFWVDAGADGVGPYAEVLYKSEDHGVTWTLVSTVIDTTANGGESGLLYLGNNTLLFVGRHALETKTYLRRSTDLGATWGTLTEMQDVLGVLQRPRLRKFGSRTYLLARDRVGETTQHGVIWRSDDDGVTWLGPYYLSTTAVTDAAYADVLLRDNGDLYVVSYTGSDTAAQTVEYVLRENY